MEMDTAQSAAQLVPQIQGLQALLAKIETALTERWPITVLKVAAPAEGASLPEGTTIDLLPAGAANNENSQLALTTAQKTYQAQLDVLNAQLAAL